MILSASNYQPCDDKTFDNPEKLVLHFAALCEIVTIVWYCFGVFASLDAVCHFRQFARPCGTKCRREACTTILSRRLGQVVEQLDKR